MSFSIVKTIQSALRKGAAQGEATSVKGVIAWPSKIDNLGRLRRRQAVIAEQLAKAGVPDICVLSSEPALGEVSFPVTTADALAKSVKGSVVVIVPVDQYHVSHEWIRDLVEKVKETGQAWTHENYVSPLVGHLRLRSAFLAVPGAAADKVVRAVGAGEIALNAPKAWFRKRFLALGEMPITATNVSSFYRQASALDLPYSFVVETNSSCNYHCLMCPYHGARQKNKPTFLKAGTYRDMPFETFTRVIDEISALERPYEDDDVTAMVSPYRRGELLLYPQWREALRHIKSKPNLKAYFSSNGSLWSESDVDFVVDVGLDQLQISVEGHDLETHKRIRLNDEFAKVAETIRTIMRVREEKGKSAPLLQLAHTVNERNFDKVGAYIDFWIDKVDALFLGPENYAEDDSQNKRYKTEFSPVAPMGDEYRPPCSMVKDNIWIDAEGTVILCIGSKQTVIGDINRNSIQEILNAPVRLEVLANHAAGKYASGVCRNCAQWYSAYGKTIESEMHSAFMSPDTQYYRRKGKLTVDW